MLFDPGAFVDSGEEAVFICFTDAAGDAAVFGDGIAQSVADHTVVIVCGVNVTEGVIDHLKGGFSVVIVSIDDYEGRVADLLCSAEDSVAGAPGLGATQGDLVATGELVELLVGIADLHRAMLQALAHGGHKVLPDGFLDNNDCGLEACLVGIKQGIVQNGFALAAYGIDLLQTAVTAAHAGGQYNEYRFFVHKNAS